MVKRDPIEEWFLKQFGRFDQRLEPNEKQTIIDSIAKDVAKENDQSNDSLDPLWGWSEAEKAKVSNEPLDQSKEPERDNSPMTAEEIEEGMWEGQDTENPERTAYRLWKPERTVEAGERSLEFPTDFRLDCLLPWEKGTSTIEDAVQVIEGTHHEIGHGDIITTPEGIGYVISPPSTKEEQMKDFPDIHWENYQSEPVKVPNLATGQAKESPEHAQGFTEAEQKTDIKDFGHVIDAHERREPSYVARLESEVESKLWQGKGQTDEKMILSGGQTANSWADALRPEKGPQDLAAAVKEMGLEPAIERQKAQEEAKNKTVEKGQERGGEGMEP